MKNTERTVTPEWGALFELAKQLVQNGLAEGQGRELVLEMLNWRAA